MNDIGMTLAELLPVQPASGAIRWRAYLSAVIVVALCTGVAGLMFRHFEPTNLCMVYLVGVVIVAVRHGLGPSVLASLLSVAAFDFFFIVPYLTFAVDDSQYLLTFGVMLFVAVTISALTVRVKLQAEAASERERRTASLYDMSREFANSRGIDNLIEVAARHIRNLFNSDVTVLLPDANNRLARSSAVENTHRLFDQELAMAQWAYEHGQVAGFGTNTVHDAKGLYVPLVTSQRIAGVLGIYPATPDRAFSSDQLRLLETFANHTALAIERSHFAEETERVRLQVETERLRNSLLSSVSHDLRTPLAAITGAVSSLLENEATLDLERRRELAKVALEEAERLNHLVGNLLTMTRLESGGVHVEKEWQLLDEVVGTALGRPELCTTTHPIRTHIPPDLPLVPIDGVLIEQVLLNLLDNAIKYAPGDTPIDLSARTQSDAVLVEVADCGPGIAPGDEQRVFEKFYRVRPATVGGVGLGLTICRGIVEAHGGHIMVKNREGGGAVFSFTLPLDGESPEV